MGRPLVGAMAVFLVGGGSIWIDGGARQVGAAASRARGPKGRSRATPATDRRDAISALQKMGDVPAQPAVVLRPGADDDG